jgi:hypothetical protein
MKMAQCKVCSKIEIFGVVFSFQMWYTMCQLQKCHIFTRAINIFYTFGFRLSLYVFSIFFPLSSVTSLACLFVFLHTI